MHWWARPVGYPWIPGTEGILAQPGVAPHTQGLKVLYKSSSCCPCSVSGAKRRRKSRREGRSSRLTVLQLLRVPAEHRAGKCSWKRAFPSWKMLPLLEDVSALHPPGTSPRYQQCGAGQGRSHPFPCPARGAQGSLHAPHRAAGPPIIQHYENQNKPQGSIARAELEPGSGKAQELPEHRGPLPALPCKSCRKALRNHPLPQGSPRGWWHLPPRLSQPS